MIACRKNLQFFTGLNNIQNRSQLGDIIFIYVDDLVNPNYYAYIICSGDGIGLNGLVKNIPDNRMLRQITFRADGNLNNYFEPIFVTSLDEYGHAKSDSFNINENITSDIKNLDNVDVPIQFDLNKRTGFGLFYQFETSIITIKTNIIEY